MTSQPFAGRPDPAALLRLRESVGTQGRVIGVNKDATMLTRAEEVGAGELVLADLHWRMAEPDRETLVVDSVHPATSEVFTRSLASR